MTPLLLFAAIAAPPVDNPKTYLATITGIELGPNESIEEFKIETWGVEFRAVCRIPGGWWIEAGSSATPQGSLSGRGSLGATWLDRSGLRQLRKLALVTLYAPVQRDDIRDRRGHVIIPSTFSGHANVYGPKAREIKLTYRNVQLVPAKRCPP